MNFNLIKKTGGSNLLTNMTISKRNLALLGLSLLIFLVISTFIISLSFTAGSLKNQYATRLAQSFTQGNLYLTDLPRLNNGHINTIDISWFNDKAYWPAGPFPSAVLVPLVFLFDKLGLTFPQILGHYFLTAIILFLIFQIAKKLNYPADSCWFFSFAFFFSVFLQAPLNTLFFNHLIIVLLIWAAIWEYLTHKRYWLLGAISAFCLATRGSVGFLIIFFILDILIDQLQNNKQKIKNLIKLISPMIIMIVLLGVYNFVRFGSPLETGYSYQILFPMTERARDYGLFNLIHLPGNLYYLLLHSPLPVFKDAVSHVLTYPYIKADPWGIGIFFTSPFLLYLFFLKYKNKLAKILLITSSIIAIPILLYYGIGYVQFGYRYALDFLPLLFFLFMILYREKKSELSFNLKLLMIVSALINWYLLGYLFIK